MQWSVEQQGALDAVSEWYEYGGKRFRLDGYAGSGKTTLAKHFAKNVQGTVLFGAFTGKAASVLRAKGCHNATTIHSMIYKPAGDSIRKRLDDLKERRQRESEKDEPDQELIAEWTKEITELEPKAGARFTLQADPEITMASLVIIDESSMLDMKMVTDLESFGVPILYLGDPGQLPPVGGKPFLSNSKADYFLHEIHRQAAESPIIRLATLFRQGGYPEIGDQGDVKVLSKRDFDYNILLGADQVIVGKNATRRNINKAMRQRLGRTNVYPEAGDKLICLKNNHDVGLLNGVTCRALKEGLIDGKTMSLDIEYDGDELLLVCDPGYFQETYGKRTVFPSYKEVEHFDYGYAITGHKSQGSQWEHVVVCDDRMQQMDLDFRAKWLYTVATRAEKRLTFFT